MLETIIDRFWEYYFFNTASKPVLTDLAVEKILEDSEKRYDKESLEYMSIDHTIDGLTILSVFRGGYGS